MTETGREQDIQYAEQLERVTAERDRLREALKEALPIVIDTLRHLRATNNKEALHVSNVLADIRVALQEDNDE